MSEPQAIEFTIPGRAIPRSRPRVRYGGQHAYYPERYEAWRTTAKLIAGSAARSTGLWKDHIMVTARFYYKGLADADNLMSAVFDVLTGSVIFDDRYIVEFHGYKIPDKNERTEVRVEILPEDWISTRTPEGLVFAAKMTADPKDLKWQTYKEASND